MRRGKIIQNYIKEILYNKNIANIVLISGWLWWLVSLFSIPQLTASEVASDFHYASIGFFFLFILLSTYDMKISKYDTDRLASIGIIFLSFTTSINLMIFIIFIFSIYGTYINEFNIYLFIVTLVQLIINIYLSSRSWVIISSRFRRLSLRAQKKFFNLALRVVSVISVILLLYKFLFNSTMDNPTIESQIDVWFYLIWCSNLTLFICEGVFLHFSEYKKSMILLWKDLMKG